jgi:hypothetical protein
LLEQIKIVFQRVKLLLTCNQISLALQPFGALRLQYSLSDTKSASKHTASKKEWPHPTSIDPTLHLKLQRLELSVFCSQAAPGVGVNLSSKLSSRCQAIKSETKKVHSPLCEI